MSLDRYPIDPDLERFIEVGNSVFYFVFIIELVLKLVGLGYKSYFRDNSNKFDFVIVVLSTMDVIL